MEKYRPDKSQETADLITFTEEILMENLIFCAVYLDNIYTK